MASLYYIGTFEGKEIFQPIQTSGSRVSLLLDLLEASNINVEKDFHISRVNDLHDPLFYQVTNENRHFLVFNDQDMLDIWQEYIPLDSHTSFPLVCDEMIHNGISYHMVDSKVFEPDYSRLKKLNLTVENIYSYLEDVDKEYEEWFLKEVIDTYNQLVKWMEENKKIYWNQYY